MAAFFMQVSSPAHGEIIGDGRPVSVAWCETEIGFALLVAQLRAAMSDAPPGCHSNHFTPAFPTPQMMTKAVLVAGPYADFEGDTFAVFRIERRGITFFPFIWWAPGFSPLGVKA
jgi:hypothetical protein